MSPYRRDRRVTSAFTLLEILVAVTVLSLVVLVLANILSQSTTTWQRGLSDTQHRQKARAALDFIGRDLRKASLPLERNRQDSLRFEINPPVLSGLAIQNSASIFWQAPLSTENARVLMEVGYFVYWKDGKAALYRFSLKSSDPGYVLNDPNASLLSVSADWSSYLFLENVIGLWVKPYGKNGNVLSLPFDSRTTHTLPTLVELSLVVIDAPHAARIKSTPSYPSDALSFVNALPDEVRPGATILTMRINLENSTGW